MTTRLTRVKRLPVRHGYGEKYASIHPRMHRR